ncbi:MAG TPA: hypothetical protein VFX49_10060 [Chloroflexota bacterium]|nr:hypothetical protein [Chloroflexota bacterium]
MTAPRSATTRRAALLGAAALVVACRPAARAALPDAAPNTPVRPPALAPSATAASRSGTLGATATFDEDTVAAGIQATLDRQAAARSAADREAFTATVDQRNLVWRRIQSEAFAAATARGAQPGPTYRVTRIEPKQAGYVKAWIDVLPPNGSEPTAQGVWVFREAENGWLHTEILNEELGPRKTLETEHFTLLYYEWDDDVIERVGATAERAHARILSKTGLGPSVRPTINVNPTYGSHSALRGFGTWALYMSGSDTILIRSLESYGAGMTAPGEAPEDRLLVALTHEYGHLVNNSVVSTVKMPKWMVEGFAEYVADNLRAGSLLSALRGGRTMTLDRASEIIEWGEDPGRGFTGADLDLAYAHSAHATTYFMERFGQDRFFALATEFADTRRWEPAFQTHAGIAWSDFERDWVAWARRRYGL